MVNQITLILAVVFFVILAGFFAGAETGIYRLSRLRLRIGVEKKRLSSIILSKSLRDSEALLLSTLLGTNLAHYLATSIVTYMLLRQMEVEHTAELLATLLTAPVLFVFAELIPKNIFFYRADFVMPFISPVLFAFHKLFSWCGAVPLLKSLSRIFAQLTGSPRSAKTIISAVQRTHIKAIVQEIHEEGILSTTQTDIINRLVSISDIHIKSVMTPVKQVAMVDVNSDKAEILEKLKKCVFTRLPVYERYVVDIVGFVNIYECLSSTESFEDLHNFIKPIRELSADISVTEAISIMRSENQKIVLVVKSGHLGRSRPVGIVTMKDLVEELLGELAEW